MKTINNICSFLVMAALLIGNVTQALAGPMVLGNVNTNAGGDGAISAVSIMKNSSASVEVGAVTGNATLIGDLNTNYSMQGATSALSVAGGCSAVRIGSIADQPLCKSGGGGFLDTVTGFLGL